MATELQCDALPRLYYILRYNLIALVRKDTGSWTTDGLQTATEALLCLNESLTPNQRIGMWQRILKEVYFAGKYDENAEEAQA